MSDSIRKPILVFDGNCSFCQFWVDRYTHYTGERVECSKYQDVSSRYPHIPVKNFQSAVHLIFPTGEVYTGAHAIAVGLSLNPGAGKMLWGYDNIPGAAAVLEFFYRVVAGHRPFFMFMTRLFLGKISK